MTETTPEPLLTIGGKAYKLDDLSEALRGLVNAVQVAEGQIAHHQHTLAVLSVGRDSLLKELNAGLEDVEEVAEE